MAKSKKAIGLRSRWAIAVLAVALGLLSGCAKVSSNGTDSATEPAIVESSAGKDQTRPAAKPVAPSHCPSGLHGCRTTEGRIVYVEKVDPDGDGDAHFVVVDPQGITLPGLTAIDVRKGLRPRPLPGIGEEISAAGPVETGSYGQSQIAALVVHTAGG